MSWAWEAKSEGTRAGLESESFLRSREEEGKERKKMETREEEGGGEGK